MKQKKFMTSVFICDKDTLAILDTFLAVYFDTRLNYCIQG